MSALPDPVELEISPEGIAVVRLNRPSRRNAFDESLIATATDIFRTLRSADHVRFVALMGAGETFCAGADLDWMKRQGGHSQADNEADALALAEMLKALHDLPHFTCAFVQGAAMGGGAGLVAAADYAVAVAGATFRFSEVRLGLTPATISPYVIEAIGARAARGLFASALPFDADLALALGLVQEVAADLDALHGAFKRLSGLALENAPGAVADAKSLVREVAGRPLDHGLMRHTAKAIAARRASDEGQEGLAAFLAKRRPLWEPG
jgi:methylglutaconyl-CoA hydratase